MKNAKTLKPYRIGKAPFDEKNNRFVYNIDGIDYYGSIAEYKGNYEKHCPFQNKCSPLHKSMDDFNATCVSKQDRLPTLTGDELQEARENIEMEREAFRMDYVDFCNEFWYDANKKESVKIYKYGREIYGYNGVC